MLRQRSAPTKRSTTRRGRTRSKLSAAKKKNTSQNGIRRLESFRRLHLSAKRRASAKRRRNENARAQEIARAQEKEKEEIFTAEFMSIIHDILIPHNKRVFRDIDDIVPTTNGHTNHLYQVGLPEPFIVNDRGFKKEYRYVFERSKCKMVIVLGPRNFTIYLDTYEEDNKDTPHFNENTSNNISLTYQAARQMYIYGVKSLNEPRIRGNVLNKCMFDICKSMKIPNVFIADDAGPPCAWDEKITIHKFSIIRAIVGKPTFYESIPGHFFDPEKAEAEKRILEQTNDDDKAFIKEYLKLKPINDSPGCDRINHITKQALATLTDPKYPEITKYVMTPYQ